MSMRRPSGPGTDRGVTSCPSAADSQGNQAPRRPASRAASCAAWSRRTRYVSIARAAAGRVAAKNGRTKTLEFPEDMPPITGSGQAARTQWCFTLPPDGCVEMKQREPDRALEPRVALHADVHLAPPSRPRRALVGDDPIDAPPTGAPQQRDCASSRRCAHGVDSDGDDTLELATGSGAADNVGSSEGHSAWRPEQSTPGHAGRSRDGVLVGSARSWRRYHGAGARRSRTGTDGAKHTNARRRTAGEGYRPESAGGARRFVVQQTGAKVQDPADGLVGEQHACEPRPIGHAQEIGGGPDAYVDIRCDDLTSSLSEAGQGAPDGTHEPVRDCQPGVSNPFLIGIRAIDSKRPVGIFGYGR